MSSAAGRLVQPAKLIRRLLPAVVLTLIYAAAAGITLADFITWPGLNRTAPGIGGTDFFGAMLAGRAPQPYVTRALVPLLVRSTRAVVPPGIARRLAERVRRLYVRDGRPDWLNQHALEFELVRGWLFLFLMLFAWSLRRLAGIAGLTGLEQDTVPLLGLAGLPVMFGYVSHIYDLSGLALFTLGLCLIAEKHSKSYLIVFACACLNKETAILLAVIWTVLNRRRLPFKHLLAGVAGQFLLWAAIRGGLLLVYRHNPGSPIELRLLRNLAAIAEPRNWLLFRPFLGQLVIPTGLNILTVLAYLLSGLALPKLPRIFQISYLLTLPVLVLAMLFGNIDEMRIYYELYPAAVVAFAAGLWRLLGYRRTEQTTAMLPT